MSRGGRLQNLRDFTVQIRPVADDPNTIAGTGIVVSTDGKIATCAHVIRALGIEPRSPDGAEVGVYFPQARGGEAKARRAAVAACFPQHDDDVVLLQLVDGPSPLGLEQIAALGTAAGSPGHAFRSYGYAPIGDRLARYVDGEIMGPVEIALPSRTLLRAEPIELRTRDVRPGISGAGVLDEERNLVVGLITERWNPGGSPVDDNIAWATDACVLTFDPFNFPLRSEDLPQRAAPQPKTDIPAAQAAAAPSPGLAWNNAPPPLAEWVGREELLKAITEDWLDTNRHITGLIGFGGEGKSSLARKWVDDLLNSPLLSGEGPGVRSGVRAQGLFWWGFYERPSVDEFFEAALTYMSGGALDPRQYPSSNAKAHLIAGMLYAGRYLFVLDGLEVLQHQEGDEYGLLRSGDLREFLGYFAEPGHESFCLVTSRAPLLDLMEYTAYTHRDVDRLSPADGRTLLSKIGVQGSDIALDKVVADWDGHALTLSLIGGYLVDLFDGDIAHVDDIPAPTAGEPRYEHVHRVLRRYDEHLSEAERAFLTLFSAFRTPVDGTAFEKVFRAKTEATVLNAPIAALDDASFDAMVKRLVKYRILRRDPQTRLYTTHPLIRNHYFARLTAGERAQAQAAHQRIKDYYLAIAGDTPHNPTLDDLKPLIEVVHHACQAAAYDEAYTILQDHIYQPYPRRVLADQLGAWDTALALMLDFFPSGDTAQEPQVSDPTHRSWILNEIGLCLMSLGRLVEAAPFYERGNSIDASMEDWNNASIDYQNLSALYAYLGALAASADAAREALALARRAENQRHKCDSLTCQAWATHLRGEREAAGAAFRQAEALQREIDPTTQYLYVLRGIRYADHLRQIGNADHARLVTEANLEICERNHWPDHLSQCHRILGDLDADAGRYDSARLHYDEALKIARGISRRDVLIEALLARGRWHARHARQTSEVSAAFSDLNEALGYAVQGGYRIYEADIRIALAWAHLTPGPSPLRRGERGEIEAARAEAERARTMSAEMGYYWGQVDADEVMKRMKDELELSAGGIPVSLKPFFQEYDFSKLDAERHRDLVIERTLGYGDRREVRWLYRRYGRQAIADWVRDYGSRLLSRRRFSYWRTVLDIGDFKRPAHWDNRIWPH